jgi:hypothetical protein
MVRWRLTWTCSCRLCTPQGFELYGSQHYSDVVVRVCEEADDEAAGSGQAGGADARVPCHAVVLRSASDYFKTLVSVASENWCS